jgi:4-hydroxy-2-oxoheptanedioate aldolase
MVIVRVPKHDEVSLSTALDAGAAGIVIPHCESAEDVKHFMKDIYYRTLAPLLFLSFVPFVSTRSLPSLTAPMGQRSFSPWTFTPGISDASLYADDSFNMKNSNNHICVIPQIESVKGVENIEEIAALEGVSALMFGPGDYSADAGIPLKLGGEPHPDFLAAMGKFSAAAQKYKRPLFG